MARLAILLCLLLALPGWAQEPNPSPHMHLTEPPMPQPTPPPDEEAELDVGGIISTSYSYNFNRPANGRNALRGYDFDARKLKLDLLDLNLQYGLGQEDQAGFRLELAGGGSMPRIDASLGLFRDVTTGVSTTDVDIRQMFFSYTTQSGFRVDAGKFATIFGYEVPDGVDGINPNATRSLGYTYSPYFHTGLRMIYPLCDEVSLTGLVVLGADNWTDQNRSVSLGGQLAVTPAEDVSLIFNVLEGPEQLNNDTNRRLLLEAVTSWQIAEQVKIAVQVLSGRERVGTLSTAYTASWQGLAVYLQTRLSDDFALNLRQEFWNDPTGIRLGLGQAVSSFTVTPSWQVTEDLTLRCDFRFDRSTAPVFDSRGSAIGSQSTIFFNQVYKF